MQAEMMADLERRAALHSALGDPHRLAIVDALALSDVAPSELAELLRMESNLLAHHLAVLDDAGILQRSSSRGDRRRRYLRLRHDAIAAMHGPLTVRASSVLFVCTANSARSQLAAAMWNASHDVPATSAGTEPAAAIHPLAKRAAARRHLDLSRARPVGLDAAPADPDLVVTVCDRAHEQLRKRPRWRTRTLHWSIADPAIAGTTRAFDEAAGEIESRIRQLAPAVVRSSRNRSRSNR